MNNGRYSEEELRQLVISVRKSLKESKKAFSTDTCLICNKKVTSFCKSHTIPRFVLDNIGDEGYVYTVNPKHNPLIKLAAKEKIGIADANVFFNICRECDDVIFKEYETPDNWINFNKLDENKKQRLMNLVFLKNSLRELYNDVGGADFYKKMEKLPEELNVKEIFDTSSQQEVEKLDFQDHLTNVKIGINGINNNLNQFDILYFKKVHYCFSVASQCTFVPHLDLKGNVINDIFDMKATMRYLSVCIFPLGDCSVILLFSLKDDTPYLKPLIQDFLSLSEREKSRCLLALVLGHTSGQLFFNKYMHERITDLPIIQKYSVMNLTGYKESSLRNFSLDGVEKVNLDDFRKLPDVFSH